MEYIYYALWWSMIVYDHEPWTLAYVIAQSREDWAAYLYFPAGSLVATSLIPAHGTTLCHCATGFCNWHPGGTLTAPASETD